MSGQASASIEQNPGIDEVGLTDEELKALSENGPDTDSAVIDDEQPTLLSLDKQFELLKNQRRRWVLSYLMENDEASTTGELAEHVAVLENGKESVEEINSKERKAAYVGLYQCHLPKMDDYGVIKFNQARGTIELKEPAYELEQYLGSVEPDRWVIGYLGIAVGGGALFTVTTIAGLSLLATLAAGATIIGLIVTAAWHWRKNKQG